MQNSVQYSSLCLHMVRSESFDQVVLHQCGLLNTAN